MNTGLISRDFVDFYYYLWNKGMGGILCCYIPWKSKVRIEGHEQVMGLSEIMRILKDKQLGFGYHAKITSITSEKNDEEHVSIKINGVTMKSGFCHDFLIRINEESKYGVHSIISHDLKHLSFKDQKTIYNSTKDCRMGLDDIEKYRNWFYTIGVSEPEIIGQKLIWDGFDSFQALRYAEERDFVEWGISPNDGDIIRRSKPS